MHRDHHPVLLQEVGNVFQTYIDPLSSPVLIDATFGRGGHTDFLMTLFPKASVYAMDQDPEAIAWGQAHFSSKPVRLFHQPFSQMDALDVVPGTVSGILFDLGLSSPQIDTPERGFSFQKEGPLDMRMSREGPSALDIIRGSSEKELADIIFYHGQERRARVMARLIHKERHTLHTTSDLANLIAQNFFRSKKHASGKIHPATRVFQALRMAVNQEMQELALALPKALELLAPGGVLVVISFHSLEDGYVKRFIRGHTDQWEQALKRPLKASEQEESDNPRSRSACLRWAVKKKIQGV